ncbi:MAG: hypothetical protein M3R35_07670 [Candidatus Eremiobacteraeota bacterium]|nr:hypothetical protein [Candidatus Eremiobacteraeota bacterium]
MMRVVIAALVFAAYAAFAVPASANPVPAPAIMRYGGATIVQQNDPQSALVGTELFVRAGLDRQRLAESGLAALVAQAILDTPVRDASGANVAMHDAVQNSGGSVTYDVDGHDVRFYLEGLKPAYASRLLPLFQTALAKPDLSEGALRAARSEIEQKIAANQQIALTVGIEMLNGSFYADSGAGLPEYGMAATLSNLTSADAQSFYAAMYRRDGAIVSVAGDAGSVNADAYRGLLNVLPAGSSNPIAYKSTRLEGSSRELRTHRDVPAPWLVAQYPAPAASSSDFGPMLVLTGFMENTLADVSELPTVATKSFVDQGVGALYNFDAQPANLIVYVDGGLGDPSRTFDTALAVVNVLSGAKLHGSIDQMKATATGQFVNGAATLEDRAWLAGVFAMQNLPPDYLNRTLAAIDGTSIGDLQRVARKYLRSPAVALVLPRSMP